MNAGDVVLRKFVMAAGQMVYQNRGYHKIKTLEHMLPNGKKLVQIDFER